MEEKINLRLEKEESDNSRQEKKKTEFQDNFDQKPKKKSSDDQLLAKKQIEVENAYNPEGFYLNHFDEMNNLHNDGMYKRANSKRESERERIMKNYQTERVHRKILQQ